MRHRRRRRGDIVASERGAASTLAVVLMTPLLVVLCFGAFQAAMWSHARTEARVIARDVAALVARAGVAPDDASASARSILATDTDLADPSITVVDDGEVVTVTISGRAPGIIRGTGEFLSVTVAVPVEGWTP